MASIILLLLADYKQVNYLEMKKNKIIFLIAFTAMFLSLKLKGTVITGTVNQDFGPAYSSDICDLDFNSDSFTDLHFITDGVGTVSLFAQNGCNEEVDIAGGYTTKLSLNATIGNQSWNTFGDLINGVLGHFNGTGPGYVGFKLSNGCIGWVQVEGFSDFHYYIGNWAYSDVVGQNLKAGATSLSGIEDLLYSNISFKANYKNIVFKNIPEGKILYLKIFNSIGELVLSQNVKQTNEEIPLSGFINGNYIAVLENKGEFILSRKIIIAN